MNELQQLIAGSKPTLVEFYADWCPHCKRMMPVVEELRQAEGAKINIVQIEGDDNPEIMDSYHVTSYPTWLIFKDGQEVWRDGGEKPLSELKDMVGRFI